MAKLIRDAHVVFQTPCIERYYFLAGLGISAVCAFVGLKERLFPNIVNDETFVFDTETFRAKKVVLYGSKWSASSKNQVETFARLNGHYKYVECGTDSPGYLSEECLSRNVRAVPSWELGEGSGIIRPGPMSWAHLGLWAGCGYTSTEVNKKGLPQARRERNAPANPQQ
eukprot:TRINITY_DN2859_c0_g1_i1.p1 TRINITY_DN2859_c0_g1~~TRINITY_DN2859_c0_g1_i1.p1  ORF type:complete len:169 (-),score=23.41 TRINITY_DN2859_c0_g1_i1:33-539(-)